jgi:predicted XRE-type DNA-binding protein
MKHKAHRRNGRITNVFEDLGFDRAEAENLRVRSQLMSEIVDRIMGMTQVQAAALLGVSQPRISHLRAGKINLFTIDTLVNMLTTAGFRVGVRVLGKKKRSAA